MKDRWNEKPQHEYQKKSRAIYAGFKAIVADRPKDSEAKVLERVQKLSRSDYKEIARVLEASDGFNCIIHGDVWVNNFMFK